ncbi:cyclin-dependent kinase inhibitor 1-like isoform X1 [Arapaima gigas]
MGMDCSYHSTERHRQQFTAVTGHHCRIMPIDKRVLEALKGGSAQRRLFGPVDHEKLQRDHRKLLWADLQDASRRWGFNFLTDTPLEGSDFQWESVPVVKMPALYHPSIISIGELQNLRAAPEPEADDTQRSKEPVPCIPERCSIMSQNLENMPEARQNHGVKRKQTNITDFYQAKRRAVSTPRKSGQ